IRPFLKELLNKAAADITWMTPLPKRHWAEEERRDLRKNLEQVYDRLRCLLEQWPSAIQDQDKRVEKALDKELPDLIAECKKRQTFDRKWLEDLRRIDQSLQALAADKDVQACTGDVPQIYVTEEQRMDRPDWVPAGIDLNKPSAARVYDYCLGGSHNFAADRAVAEALNAAVPDGPLIARANRAFLHRAVRYLID